MFKKIIFLFGLLILVFCPFSVQAQEKAEAETVNVTASIASKVSEKNSYLEINTKETLADPVNHSILLTIYLLDKDKRALADKEVLATSSRGQVDIIEAISKLSQFKASAAQVSEMQKDKTDQNGRVSFRLTSFVSGKAVISILADGAVNLEKTEINFLPLPFPANLTVSVGIPGINRELVLLSPASQEQNLSSGQKQAKSLVNLGSKIKIPFWLFFLLVIIILGSPIFMILNFINLRKLRKIEKQEIELIAKIAATFGIDHTAEKIQEVKNGRFDHNEFIQKLKDGRAKN